MASSVHILLTHQPTVPYQCVLLTQKITVDACYSAILLHMCDILLMLLIAGTGVAASALAFDELRSKQVWSSQGLPTAAYRAITPDTLGQQDMEVVLRELGGSVVVKPACEGSSLDTQKASTVTELEDALVAGFNNPQLMLVEEFLPGREFTVTYYLDQLLPAVEILLPEHGIYSREQKFGKEKEKR